jgi:predicted nucleotidyltransferase
MEFELPQDFKELLESLNRHKVRYLVVGGYAVGFHGWSRTTNDIDIVVADDSDNAMQMVAALTEFGFGQAGLSVDLFTRPNSLVTLGVEPVAIDILNYLRGVDLNKAFENAKIVVVEDIEVKVVSYQDLIANKRAVDRLQDKIDVEKLEKINA